MATASARLVSFPRRLTTKMGVSNGTLPARGRKVTARNRRPPSRGLRNARSRSVSLRTTSASTSVPSSSKSVVSFTSDSTFIRDVWPPPIFRRAPEGSMLAALATVSPEGSITTPATSTFCSWSCACPLKPIFSLSTMRMVMTAARTCSAVARPVTRRSAAGAGAAASSAADSAQEVETFTWLPPGCRPTSVEAPETESGRRA